MPTKIHLTWWVFYYYNREEISPSAGLKIVEEGAQMMMHVKGELFIIYANSVLILAKTFFTYSNGNGSFLLLNS